MATNIYDPCTNPVSGETFQTISFNPDSYIMQWTVQPKGYVPFEHIHLHQDEIFHVEKGEIRIQMQGNDHVAKTGESITVPRGMAHIAFNNRDEILDCRVEYKPALDHDRFMQCFMGLTHDQLLDKKGGISIPRMGYFLRRMNAKCMTRPTEIPAVIFNIALSVFYLRGSISGWAKLYKKYTGL